DARPRIPVRVPPLGAGAPPRDVTRRVRAGARAPACGAAASGTQRLLCGINEPFTSAAGDNIQAAGLSTCTLPGTGPGDTGLTLKPTIGSPNGPPSNTDDESGLGVQAAGGGCVNPECEINVPNAVRAIDMTPGGP